MACYRAIPSADNILIIVTICFGLYKYFASTYYNDKGWFIFSFGEYITPYLKGVDYSELIE